MVGQRPQISNGLHWVRAELEVSLARARSLLEAYLEAPEDREPLRHATEELQTVRGTLGMIQCHGAATFAAEMILLLQALLEDGVAQHDEAFSALSGATLQMSDYLDLLLHGEPDRVLILQPALNELRAARGQALFTEAELFATQAQADGIALQFPAMGAAATPGLAQKMAKRELAAFQTAFLKWFRNGAADALLRMGETADVVATSIAQPALRTMWSAYAALTECLRGGVGDSLDLKRLYGRAGSQMKLLADEGEEAAAAQIGDTIYVLLFHVSRAQRPSDRARALLERLGLGTDLPSVAHLDDLRRRLRGPGSGILDRVHAEIRSDFAKIKDGIDLAVRTGGRAPVDQLTTPERLQHLADTLNALGLQGPRQALINQARVLSGGTPDASAWMDVATAILRIEHSLEEALFRTLGRHGDEPERSYDEIETEIPHAQELRNSVKALLRESLVDFAHLKTGVDGFLKTGEVAALSEAPRLLREVAAGLIMLNHERAAGLVLELERYIGSGALERAQAAHFDQERFADAVSCVEVYLEGLRDGLPSPTKIVEDLAFYVGRLDFTVAPAPVATTVAIDEAANESRAEAGSNASETASEMADEPAVMATLDALVPAAVVSAPISAPVSSDIDPEIREIFLEEAEEVLGELSRLLPQLRREPNNRDTLAAIRRAFHTLKGSGRMVGAMRIGEFGWTVENMLNRSLEGSLPPRAPMLEVVGNAVHLLPGLIENFRGTGIEDEAVAELMARAELLATGPVAAEPDMRSVFCDDARERLGFVQRWLEAQHPGDPEFEVEPQVIRAFHTLKGSASVVNSGAVSQLAAAFENYLNHLRLDGRGLPPTALAVLADALKTLRGWIEALAGDVAVDENLVAEWHQRLDALIVAETAAPQAAAPVIVDSVFAVATLEALLELEAQARAWASRPSEISASALSNGFSALADAAGNAQCTSLAALSRAVVIRLQDWRSAAPDSVFFARLSEVFEGFYQQLDLYREGGLKPDPATGLGAGSAEVLSLIQSLPRPLAQRVVQAVPPLDPVLPVAEVVELVPESLLAQPAPLEPEPDAELLEIFSIEAEEILETLNHYLGMWERNPSYDEALNEVRRGLHTLKGSARTAGVTDIGNVAHRLETLLENVTSLSAGSLQARLEAGLNGLQQQLDGLLRGETQPAAPVLAAIESAGSQTAYTTLIETPLIVPVIEAAPETLELAELEQLLPEVLPEPSAPFAERIERIIEPVDAGPPIVDLPEPLAEVPIIVERQVQPEPGETIAEPVAPAKYDDELGDIFSAEATELLEQLDAGFESWQNGDIAEPVRDIQRALHTLKGGARMAGVDAMGDATHELESEVNAVVESGEFPDPPTFERLRAGLETLQTMHDQLRRGQAQLLAPVEARPAPLPKPVVAAQSGWAPELFWQPGEDVSGFAASRRETARVPVSVLDAMLNEAGEISIYRSRLEEHNAGLKTQLNEMVQTITRVREQLRLMDIETEAQIAARGLVGSNLASPDRYALDFDPLEMDRYTRMQELSRTLAESINDLMSLRGSMDESVSSAETLLLQQSRITSEVQQGLMGTLMVPFSRQMQRLLRVVRQTAQENGKQADLQFVGAQAELDRNVLERMTAPLEHLLRNSVVHGIEDPAARALANKPPVGVIQVELKREGSQLLVEVSDDGAGLNFAAIRNKAVERGLMAQGANLSEDALARFIFEPGFTTARRLTQDAGRGIGMDAVASEVKQLGGTLELRSEFGRGTRFLIRLPLTLAVSQALLVGVGAEVYAVPLPSIEGIGRITRTELPNFYRDDGPLYQYGNREYRVHYLGDYLDIQRPMDGESRTLTVILVRLGEGLTAGAERRVALVIDQLIGNREVVSKTVGPQVSSVPGVAGATILADGRVVLILDVPALIIESARRVKQAETDGPVETRVQEIRATIMVVDDSVTMRRVAERLLTRQGYRIVTAKDGLDAIALLQTELPDTVLLDIEMPRADGFEVAAFIRNNERLRKVPIIMITSRSGEKHRERARSIGVDSYLTKPYQEEQLLAEIKMVRGEQP